MCKKFSLIFISVICVLNSILPVYAEIKDKTIYIDAVEKLQNASIIIGRDVEGAFDDMFDVSNVKRAEFAGVISYVLREDVLPKTDITYFEDCAVKDWYTPFVNVLYELKIVNGYGNDKFNPENNLTNFEAVTMLVRCLGYDNIKTTNEAYPYKYIEIAEGLSLFANTTINKADDAPITYGNMFVLLLNAMRCDVNNSSLKLWDYSNKTGLLKLSGTIKSTKDNEFVLESESTNITIHWKYNENLSFYSGKNVTVWYNKNETENYAIDMIIL